MYEAEADQEIIVQDEPLIPYDDIGVNEDEDPKDEAELEFDENAKLSSVKRLFSQLDPAISKAQGEAIGELGIALRYKADKELLLIRVLAAQGLASREVARKSVDPQVEILILDSVEEDVAKSSVKKGSNNPVWNEILVFKLEEAALEGSRLLLRVVDNGEVLGEVMTVLQWDMMDGEPEWYNLEDQRDWSISGAVHVRVRYTTPTTLHVNVASAEGICGKNKDKLSNPYVRVTLAGKYPVKTTKVIKDTVNPVWSEVFDYAIPVQLLQTATILLAVYNKNALSSDEFLGEARVSLGEFKHFHQIDSWFPLADLKHVARHRSEWSKGAVEQELREALVAHIACRSPNLIFNQNQPKRNRIIRLSCPKAGQKTKITFGAGNSVIE